MSDLPKPISQEVKPSRQRLPSARGNWPRPGFRNAALCLPDSPGGGAEELAGGVLS